MKKITAFLIIILFLVILFTPSSLTADEGVGVFYVVPKIPKNQIDKRQSYFDLRVKPGSEQVLNVDIVNNGSEDLIISVSAISASTASNGMVDYKTPDIRDDTMKIPFSEIATPQNESFVLKTGASTVASIDLKIPEEEFDGVILGGLYFSAAPEKIDEDKLTTSNGVAIDNRYSYVLGTTLSETDVKIEPEFQLLEVKADVVEYKPAIVHSIRNTEAAIANNMEMNIDIFKEGSNEPVLKEKKESVDFAPNSVMNYPFYIDIETIEPGDYISKINLVSEDREQQWNLSKKFTISEKEKERIQKILEPESPFSPWGYVAAGVIVLLLLIIIYLSVKLRKTNQRNGN